MSMKIKDVKIRKILDSRGNPTVEVDVYVKNKMGRASAPSGASTGVHEVQAYPKGGVDSSIKIFREMVAGKLIGMDAESQAEIDSTLHELDGTDNFSIIGGNTAVAISIAVAKVAAATSNLPLYKYLGGPKSIPKPLGNVLGGGKHAIGGTDIQEYLVISFGKNVSSSVFANAKVHRRVREKLQRKYPDRALGKGDEGAWVASIGNDEAMNIVSEACNEISAETGFTIFPSLDLAASEFFKDGNYVYKERSLDEEGQIDYIASLVDKYNLAIVEDPLEQEAFEGYVKLTKKVGNRCIIVGDDLFVTNSERLKKGIQMGAANAILIKPNQIGTISDTVRTVRMAHERRYKTVISHRSGETTDETIAHLSVAFGCYAIKTGTVSGERIAKLNELIRIEEEIS